MVEAWKIFESYSSSTFGLTQRFLSRPVDTSFVTLRTPPEISNYSLNVITNTHWDYKNTHGISWNNLYRYFNWNLLAPHKKNLCCQLDILLLIFNLISLKKLLFFFPIFYILKWQYSKWSSLSNQEYFLAYHCFKAWKIFGYFIYV